MGWETHGAVARGDGSHSVQRLDLRYAEAVCGGVADGAPGDDESDRGFQEEKRIDARKTADLVRCNLLPACYVAPVEMRELRRMLRYRNLIVAQAVRMKNKMSGLLMEVGAEYNKQQL